ncbi:autotransporter domain-containing protein [Rhizobium sp. GR12]|uniref:autotransporter domain-containing protein n=1 Tax=Rhizobium sp. GR12 TaxID=3053925 RepID=UPI002FBDD699
MSNTDSMVTPPKALWSAADGKPSSCPSLTARLRFLLSISTAVITSAAFGVTPLQAQEARAGWKSGTDGSWFMPTNWQNEVIPAAQDTVDMRGGGVTHVDAPGAVATHVYVGAEGTNTLKVENAGTLDIAGQLTLGFLPGSSGTLLVDGEGSAVTVQTITSLGWQDGAGILTVENGGKFRTSTLSASGGAGSGTISVSGAGSQITVENGAGFGWPQGMPWELNISDQGRFTANVLDLNNTTAIKISNGGILDVADINANSGAAIFGVTISDVDTIDANIWENGGFNSLNKSGMGTLVLTGATQFSGGVTVADGALQIGDGGVVSFAASAVNLTGAAARLTIDSDGDLALSMPITGGGELTKRGAGTLTLSGNSASFFGGLDVAAGSLDLTGQLGSANGTIDAEGNGDATMRVVGEATDWANYGILNVGYSSSGILEISGGGSVSNTDAFVGVQSASSGEVTVSGQASIWSTGELNVGHSGTGTLTIKDGGTVSSAYSNVGNDLGGIGDVTVSGTRSAWVNGGYLAVGYSSEGTMIVENGGAVSDTYGYIGFGTESTGTVTVSGTGSNWTNSGALFVGSFGTGTSTIKDGGSVRSDAGYVGFGTGGKGSVTVSGAGSSWNNSGSLVVGASGTGTLTIADGGVVSVGGGTSAVVLGDDPATGSGTLNIGSASGQTATSAGTLEVSELLFGSGTGGLVFNHTGGPDGSVLDFAPDIRGQGRILHENGATVLSGESAGFTGTTEITGGELTVSDRLGGSASVHGGNFQVNGLVGGNVDASDTGRVTGSGAIEGSLILSNGGILSGQQGQSLAINGNLRLDAGSTIDVALGGISSPALFDVGGNLTLDGTLEITDQGGFGTGVYRLFDYAGGLTDNGLSIGWTPAGVVADDLSIQTAVEGQVNLVSTAGAELGFWDGGDAALHDNNAVDGGSGTWTADGRNWTSENGSVNGSFKPNPTFAIFQGTSGAVTVDDTAGAIGVTGMQFATDGYRVSGDPVELLGLNGETIIRVGDGGASDSGMAAGISATLGGASSLVKTGAGSLVLTGNNAYTGGTRIAAGTLWLSSDASLGASSGGLIFDGGVLATTTGFSSGRAITLNASGRVDVFGDRELALSGAISGTGGLEKLGTGTLKLSGKNTYGGNTLVRAGVLVADTDAIRGSIANAGAVIFDQAGDGSFAGDIAGLDGTRGEMIKRGAGTLTLGGVSTLAWNVEEGGLVSATDRFGGDLELASATRFTFSQDYNGTYSGAITGSGTVAFDGGGQIALTGDNSSFAGLSQVSDTTLVVNEALGGSALIENGGRLQGAGTIGSGTGSTVTLASGSTLAPGNSTGTLTVDGNLTFNTGSRYEVEVAPGGKQSDLIKVSGSATLNGGTVAHIGMTGTYDPAATYTILSAEHGVNGSFDAVTSDFAFLDPSLGYNGNDVTLSLTRNDIGFAAIAETHNQIATAQGLESLPNGNALHDAVVQLDRPAARTAFDLLSGEIHASVAAGLIEDSRHIRNVSNDRLRSALGVDSTPGKAPSGPAFWGTGFGSWGTTDANGNAGRLDRSTGGFVGGADAMVTDAWRLGLLAGYSHSSFDADDRASSASSDNYHVGLYAGTQWKALSFRSGLAYTWNDVKTNRSVGFTGFADSLSAGYDASTLQTFGEFGYQIETPAGNFEPFVNLAHVTVKTDGFGENGGAAVLASSGETTDTTFTTLGVRAENDLGMGNMQMNLAGMLGWRHAYGDTTPTSIHAFSGSDAFTVFGNPLAKDAAIVAAGVNVDIAPGATLAISYQGQFGDGAHDHGFNAELGVRF